MMKLSDEKEKKALLTDERSVRETHETEQSVDSFFDSLNFDMISINRMLSGIISSKQSLLSI